MSSTLFVDAIEPNLSSGVHIAGHVIQQITMYTSTQIINTATAFASFGCSQAFVPKYSTSKILITANIAGENFGNDDLGTKYEILQDSTQVQFFPYVGYLSASSSQNVSTHTLQWYGNAASTNSRTYEIKVASTRAGYSVRVNKYNGPSYMTIQEIAQ
tara:strand:+ start:296 stop:769 length:474 start_codon:yes stop_codon:yes gene_type:complete